MVTGVILAFAAGYLAIILEEILRLDKTVPALIMAALCWSFISLGHGPVYDATHAIAPVNDVLLHHVGKIAEILIFLLGAMTIVELIDIHRGFAVITDRINTTNKKSMLWIIAILAFFLSATLDNLASTVVLVSLLRRLVPLKKERIWYVCLAVIAANAGGAWSPIGDVTTTMLWIQEKVSVVGLVQNLVVPSLVCMGVPVLIASYLPQFNGRITRDAKDLPKKTRRLKSSRLMFVAGICALIVVPIFKLITHLPPYIGIMFSLSVLWGISEYIRAEERMDRKKKHYYSVHHALSRVEMASILFFLGILLAVAALESLGLLQNFAEYLNHHIPTIDIVILVLGMMSAVIDNVPLVAAAMGMYSVPMDDHLWHFIAYSAGTGGSLLIIGSAAGVAAMGMEKIDFIWFFKNITWLAFTGFAAGAAVYLFMIYFF